ncbi:MAG: phosphatase PAP2 family protein [Acholeplasmatales bacterium]|nr:phosphatase PAP2 family protein [Acholeplasmatales bacterium]
MKKKFNLFLIIGCGLFGLFILLMILLFVNKKEVFGVNVGLSSINQALTVEGKDSFWASFSDAFFYMSILLGVIPVFIMIFSFLKDKKFKNLNKTYVIYFISLVVMAIFYLAFDKVIVVNKRPLIDEAKSSFPSTHVFIGVYLLASSTWFYVKNNNVLWQKIAALVFAGVSGILLYVSRTLAGVHWFTDLFGGLILAAAFFFLFIGFDRFFKKDANVERKEETVITEEKN